MLLQISVIIKLYESTSSESIFAKSFCLKNRKIDGYELHPHELNQHDESHHVF